MADQPMKSLIEQNLMRGRSLKVIMRDLKKSYPKTSYDYAHMAHFALSLFKMGAITETAYQKYMLESQSLLSEKAPAKKEGAKAPAKAKTTATPTASVKRGRPAKKSPSEEVATTAGSKTPRKTRKKIIKTGGDHDIK